MNQLTHTNDAVLPELPAIDDAAAAAQAVREKLIDAITPGYQAEFDPHEAEHAGAFVEDALSEQDAAESGEDVLVVPTDPPPAFMDQGHPTVEIPPFITRTNARELYDHRAGETVADAINRQASKG
jgi:hypothetical protein